jgi:hypothetical protein
LRIDKKLWGNQENIAVRKKRIELSGSKTFRKRAKVVVIPSIRRKLINLISLFIRD